MEQNNGSNNNDDKMLVVFLLILFVLVIALLGIGTKLVYDIVSGKQTPKQELKINKNNFSFDIKKNVKIGQNIIEDINSNDIQKRKAIFNDILKSYQEAFCTGKEKTAKLPDDLYESLASSLTKSGSSDISTEEFINSNYADASRHQKNAMKQIFTAMKEVSGIRLWDISKSVIAYSILKSNKIELSRDNILKAKNCMNGKWNFNDIENHFYTIFKISQSDTHKILLSLCDDDWMSAQTNFGLKFLNMNDITYMTNIKERRLNKIKKLLNEAEKNKNTQISELENSLQENIPKNELEQLEQEIAKRKLEIEIKRQEQDLNKKKQELQKEFEKLKQQEELEKPEIESDFKYPKNADKSVIMSEKGEKVHVVSLYEAPDSVNCYNRDDCHRRGFVKIYVNDKTAPINLLLSSYESVFWDVKAEDGVKINKIYVGSYYKDRVKAPHGTLVYNLPDRLYLQEGEYFIIEEKFDKKVLTFQYSDRQPEIIIDGENGKIVPAKNLNLNHKVFSDIKSNNVQTKKALFNEMVKVHQNAFCKLNAKNAKLPDNLYEKLSKDLPEDADTISINTFISNNYANINDDQKDAIKETLESMNEINGEIRLWDVGESLMIYAILKSGGIELTKENIEKAQRAKFARWDCEGIGRNFHVGLGLNHKDIEDIYGYFVSNCGFSQHTGFTQKFLNAKQ